MDAAWPEGEEHMAKLSVNAMIGLWVRSTEVVYSVRSSSSELHGAGADFSQAFAYEGGMVWDFVYVRRLLSNGTYRPIHDAVLGFERCVVAKARRILDAPPRYLAQVKTDCLLTQRLPKRFAERLRALEALRHPDGTPVYRVKETKPLLGSSRAPRMEAERPKQRRWNGVDDPISHCLAGNSLLLTALPATGKTYLARTIVARLREQGEAVHLVSKTHCSAQNLGVGAQTADHWVQVRARGQRAKAGLAGGGGDHAAGHGALRGPGLRGSGEPGPGTGGLKAAPIGDTSHPHRFGLLRIGTNQWVLPNSAKQPAEHARPSHAVTYASCQGAHPPQPRPPGPGVLPPHAAPPVRGRLTGHELRAA